jgi:hypothetical protein
MFSNIMEGDITSIQDRKVSEHGKNDMNIGVRAGVMGN